MLRLRSAGKINDICSAALQRSTAATPMCALRDIGPASGSDALLPLTPRTGTEE